MPLQGLDRLGQDRLTAPIAFGRKLLSETVPTYFSVGLYLIYLFRDDVTRSARIHNPEAQRNFLSWWAVSGRHEYPGFTKELHAEQVRVINEEATLEVDGAAVTLPRIIAYIWQTRPGFRGDYDLKDTAALRRLTAWYYACGVPELQLFDTVMDGTYLYLSSLSNKFENISQMPLSHYHEMILDYFVDDAKRFDVNTIDGRRQFLDWLKEDGVPHPNWPFNKDVVRASVVAKPRTSKRRRSAQARSNRPDEGINIIGFARSQSGVGEDMRMVDAALTKAGIPHSLFAVPSLVSRRDIERTLDDRLSDQLPYDFNIFCMSPFDMIHAIAQHGEYLVNSKYNIGYWPWELSRWPLAWLPVYQIVDEIWAASRFTHQAFSLSAPVPVLHMPPAVVIDEPEGFPRRYFGLPEKKFLFVFAFDFSSYVARKNPMSALDAFRKGFTPTDDSVGIVFKVNNADKDNKMWAAFQAECKKDKRAFIISQSLTRPEMLGLLKCGDAFVSLHRGEGFGRILAEAMLLGKPVIATNFSGNKDYLNAQTGLPVRFKMKKIEHGEYPFSAGFGWADPDIDDAAAKMKWLATDRAYAKKLGLAGRTMIAREHSPEAIGVRYKARLKALQQLFGQTA